MLESSALLVGRETRKELVSATHVGAHQGDPPGLMGSIGNPQANAGRLAAFSTAPRLAPPPGALGFHLTHNRLSSATTSNFP